MSAPTRFLTGAREPKNAPAITFASIRATAGEHEAAPVYPPVDYLADLADWQVLGNDRAGDCVAVWWANGRRLTTARLATEAYPSQDEVWEVYKTQNPLFDPADPTSFGGPHDEGMEAQTLLEHLVKQGGPDGVRAVGFAKLDHTDLGEVKAAVSAVGSVLLIVSTTDAQQLQFEQQAPWDYDGASPADGLHAILVGGHKDEVTGDLTLVTWGAKTTLTDEFFRRCAVQAWVVVYPEHLGSREFQDGVDLAAFAEEYTRITGDPFPADVAPDPAPGPTPEPGPTPAPAPDAPVITAPAEGATVPSTQAIVGTGQAGCTVTVYEDRDGGAELGSAPVGSDNAWTVTTDWAAEPLPDTVTVTAKQIDETGQESGESDPTTFTVNDQPAPPAPDDHPDAAFIRHLNHYLDQDPFSWEVQNHHRERITRWLRDQPEAASPSASQERLTVEGEARREALADAEARARDGQDLHLRDQRAQADNEDEGYPERHARARERLRTSADRLALEAEIAAEAACDAAERGKLDPELAARLAREG